MEKKPREPEYVLRLYAHVDERTQQQGVVFAIETAEIFTNFRYDITLEDKRDGNDIELKIIGLHAPAMLMPGKGPALGTREYFDLDGVYTVRVNKMNKEVSEFSIEITPDRIYIKKHPNDSFIIAKIDGLKVTKI
ncbi:MAG: hypothetical protein L0Y80_02715 [Ignavibacteriae bacterium]|nr:hypothetical protein [Ignavibacteriota bacterium]